MAQKRLRGDNILLRLVDNGGAQEDVWKAAGSIDMEATSQILESEFLGEAAKRYDAIFEGFSFSGEFEMATRAERRLEEKIIAKNARDGADAARRFDIAITENFPDGSLLTHVLVDCEFGPIKSSFGGRAEFVKINFEAKCSERGVIGL